MAQSKIRQVFCSVLRFFNLVDRGCNLSISNIAVIVVITKIAMAQNVGLTEAGALLITLMNYAHKRHEGNKAQKDATQAEQRKAAFDKETSVDAVASQVKALAEDITKIVSVQNKITEDQMSMKSAQSKIERLADETQKALTSTNATAAFLPKRK